MLNFTVLSGIAMSWIMLMNWDYYTLKNREAISILSVTLMIITSKASFILLTGMKIGAND